MERQRKDHGRERGETKDEQSVLEEYTRAKWERLRCSFEEYAMESGGSVSEFDDTVDDQVENARATYHHDRANSELQPYAAGWDDVTNEDIRAFLELLDTNPDEAAMHCFLNRNPKFLVQGLCGGHGRYQISKPRLGKEYIPDFLIAELSSIGMEWYAVEIESPRDSPHRQDGLPSEALNIALGQVRDWRKWLSNNINYARRTRAQDGLGLVGIDSRVPGLILLGRRREYHPRFNEFRRQMIDRERISIHSYDWLAEIARSNRSGALDAELPR